MSAGRSIDDGELVGLAQRLAATPSVSGTEQAAVELVASAMEGAGFAVVIDEAGNAVGTLGRGAPGAPRLLIDGHIDSIPLHSRDRWEADPFGGDIIDDRLYGLGICDQKASIAAFVHGVGALRDELRDATGLVAVVASVNEEDMEGVALAAVVERVRPTAAIVTEPSGTRLCVGQRGRAKIEVTVTGRASHAGHASQGLNAVEALASLVDEVRRLPRPTHPDLGRRDITCIDVRSEPYPSVSTVPARAVARFDARFLPGESEESLRRVFLDAATTAWASWEERPVLEVATFVAEFETWTGRRYSAGEHCPAWWTEGRLVEQARRGLADAGIDPTPTSYAFCTNGSFTAGACGLPTIGFGVGDEHLAHQANEHVTLGSLHAGARGFTALAGEILLGPG